jgi:hypothetical protein
VVVDLVGKRDFARSSVNDPGASVPDARFQEGFERLDASQGKNGDPSHRERVRDIIQMFPVSSASSIAIWPPPTDQPPRIDPGW